MTPPEPQGAPRVRDPILDPLNAPQREAVTHTEGPVLVLAGAGSGKTRVITHRIAYLVLHLGLDPRRIVAVTFTNKAAGEMRQRVERLLGGPLEGAWIGTFHGLCLRLLRRYGERIGLRPGFQIYDRDDQLALLRPLLQDRAAGETNLARAVLGRISRAKNGRARPEELWGARPAAEDLLAAELFDRYQEALRQANALDFDDLLVGTLELFEGEPAVARACAENCEQLLVDEYQDTNRPQYELVRALSAAHGNVCVVGDEDQSIYRFRGADIRNILEFERDHPGARVIKLEQNYRSTKVILDAACALIAHNRRRKHKRLWTERAGGAEIELCHAATDRAEASWVASRVRSLAAEIPYEEMAVLYRTNAQSRLLEEIFRSERIPHQVVGTVPFYERKEIKDVMAYLRLAVNPADDVSFRRIFNVPPRGIGQATQRALEDIARGLGVPLLAAARYAVEQALVPARARKAIEAFLELVDGLAAQAHEQPVALLLRGLLERIEYVEYLRRADPDQATDRIENVDALVSAAAEYQEQDEVASLQGFLDRSALVTEADQVGSRPGVTLTTVHCAKGLEFEAVFLVGLEERLFPHWLSLDSEDDLEEERRLCYVALTRAKRFVFLGRAEVRRVQGVALPNPPSRFLLEIPAHLVRESRAGWHEAWEEPGGAYGSGSSAARAAQRKDPPPPHPWSGQPPADGFVPGRRVLHPSFGAGRILRREGSGKNLKLTIDFGREGVRKILPGYTRLEVEGAP